MSKKCADTQTHTQDDYCNPPPMLGLITDVLHENPLKLLWIIILLFSIKID